ncbi:DUF4374 domain-containing protein [Albibacterium sp.]|uniref:DUF4374 domain-containing protein n=1 Tax=Albibacterium sp. TaxID=2952885 RepID=UPI002CE639E0|nr:DUF4374 domain-containing protein [Albibacterium sp.]HUH19227.1 DUF4374 domain-containing protein [Albibacterium sp.]
MKIILKSISFLLLLTVLFSCSKDKTLPDDQTTDGNYVLWLQVGSWPNTSQYVVGVNSVDEGSVSLSGNGREVTGRADYGIIPHKGYYYYINEEEGSFVKFELKNNNWTPVKEAPYVHVNFASATYTWANDNTLIIAGPNGDYTKILYSIVDIETFKFVNGELALPAIPTGYSGISIGNLEFSNGNVYFGFNYTKDWPDPSYDKALFGVAKYSSTGLVMIGTEEDAASAGPGSSRLWTASSNVDVNGDVYMLTTPQMVNKALPSVVYKYKNGTTSLDQSYKFNVSNITGSNAVGLWFIGGGKAIVKYNNLSVTGTTHTYEYAVIDLYNKTLVKKLTDLPRDNSDYIQTVIVEDGKVYLAINGEGANDYVWNLNTTTYEVTQGINIKGDFDYILRIDVL